MSGDWIKVRCDIHEDPAVGKICAALGLDRYAVVGRLVRLWAWADAQTTDGNADVTLAYIDEITSTPGMGDAMVSARWLEVPENGRIRFPKFDRHNGKSAKKRALGAKRQQTFRSNAHVTHPSRPRSKDSVTREEKSIPSLNIPMMETSQAVDNSPTRSSTSTSTPKAAAHSLAKAEQQIAEQRTWTKTPPPPTFAESLPKSLRRALQNSSTSIAETPGIDDIDENGP